MDPEPPTPSPTRRGLLAAVKQTTFRSLRHRNFRLYFLGQIVSFTGTWMQSAALMWLMYDRTGDPRWPSWLLVAQISPTLLLGAWAGTLADRWPKDAPQPVQVDAQAAPDISWVAWLGAAVSPDTAPARPLYLRAPDAKPSQDVKPPQPATSS